jgi:hypothetical protein
MVHMGSTQNYAKFCPIILPEIKAKHEHIFVASLNKPANEISFMKKLNSVSYKLIDQAIYC